MNHENLLLRNQVEMSELVSAFHELNSVYDNQYTLYLDMQGWELLDLRIAKVIFRMEFRHFRTFTQSMKKLMNDLCNVGVANQLVNRSRKPKQNMIWSIKAVMLHYSLDDNYLFNTNLKKYIQDGGFKRN